MRFLPLIVAFCTGCASAPVPVAEVAPPPPQTEYSVPLLLADGSFDQITVEDSKPEEQVRILFCRDMRDKILCLASVKGRAEWMQVPKVAEGNDAA